VGKGEALMIDTGARYRGYCSDITRTFFVGTPPREFVEIYEAELKVSQRVLGAIRAGVTLSELDELAHKVVDDAGFGQYFPHRVGHGLGIEGHEWPSVVTGNRIRTVPGLTFTVEPGIYIPNLGGVRVEENVAVTADGVDVLTAYPRELRSL
jgi:Xaa-Pro dipeptidase